MCVCDCVPVPVPVSVSVRVCACVQVRDMVKHFQTSNGVFKAVDGISVDIEPSSITALLGPSGSGKTTLLRLIAGLEKPTGGKIYFGNEDATDLSVQDREIGFVFQSYALFNHKNVRENIKFGLEVSRAGGQQGRAPLTVAMRHQAPLTPLLLLPLPSRHTPPPPASPPPHIRPHSPLLPLLQYRPPSPLLPLPSAPSTPSFIRPTPPPSGHTPPPPLSTPPKP